MTSGPLHECAIVSLRIFKILDNSTITEKTFFQYQTFFLHPTVEIVWKRHQQSLIAGIKGNKRLLILTGDNKADSPGYKLKFTAYFCLTTLVVIDMNFV